MNVNYEDDEEVDYLYGIYEQAIPRYLYDSESDTYNENIIELGSFGFSNGDKITRVLSPATINYYRHNYRGNCFGVADELAERIVEAGVAANQITVKSAVGAETPIYVYNELENRIVPFDRSHSIVLLGPCVLDVLNSDRLIKTTDYFRSLKALNPKGLKLVKNYCNWYDDEGKPCKISMSKLLRLKS